MNEELLPIRYHLEIYENSFVNDPSAAFSSNTPFMAFHIGEHFDPRSLGGSDVPADHWWKITDVVHRAWQIDKSHIGHQVGICVSAVPRPE